MDEIICANCGEPITGNRYEVWSSKNRRSEEQLIGYICEECLDEGYHMDAENGKVYPEDDMIYVENVGWINDWDVQNGDYYCCDECGNWYTGDDVHADGYRVVCDRCYDRYDWYTCDRCGHLIPYGDHCWDGDDVLCPHCYDEVCESRPIRDYSYKPSPIFHKMPGEDTKLFMGVELETDAGDYRDDYANDLDNISEDRTLFYMKEDCSLSESEDGGVEIVTHPCSLQFHLQEFPYEDIRSIALEHGYRSHNTKTCGLHVHVSRDALGEDGTEKDLTIAKIILLVDRLWDDFVKFSRRNYAKLDQWACKPNAYIEHDDDDDTAIRKSKETSNTRYRAVNLTNYSTIEFRLFRGTLKVNTIKATLELVSNLVNFAKSVTVAQSQDATWDDIVNFQHYDELDTYLQERGMTAASSDVVEEVEELA